MRGGASDPRTRPRQINSSGLHEGINAREIALGGVLAVHHEDVVAMIRKAEIGFAARRQFDEDEPPLARCDVGPSLLGRILRRLFLEVRQTVNPGDAEHLVLQTMRGSVEYAEKSGLHVAQLRNQVTSPGGTSAEAIYHLEKGGLRTVISRAVWAAFQRSVALGGGTPVRNPDTLDGDR